MKRTFSDFAVLLAVLLPLAAWCATGWLAAGPVPQRPVLSGLLAAATLLANGLLLFSTHRRVMSGLSLSVPVIYIVLATANPDALYFTPFHGASLLLALCLFFHTAFCSVRPTLSKLLGTWASLGAAGILFPPFLWLIPLLALTSMGKAEDKLKYAAASLLSLCLPFGLYAGILFLREGSFPVGAVFTRLWDQMTVLPHPAFHFSAATLCRIALTAVATVLAIIRAAKLLDRFKTAQYRAVIRIILLIPALCLLVLLFAPDCRFPGGLVTYLPVSLLLNDGLAAQGSGNRFPTLAVILFLILLAERIACFV